MMKIFFIVIVLSIIQSLWCDNQFFKSLDGVVAAGNFSYYTLLSEGTISLVLKTRKGDADIYVSQEHIMPTYEYDKYSLHSSTCGIDEIDVPAEFKRPVGIGIYGHPSHDISQYTLELSYKTEEPNNFSYFDYISKESDYFSEGESEESKSAGENEAEDLTIWRRGWDVLRESGQEKSVGLEDEAKYKEGEEVYTRFYGDTDDRKWVKAVLGNRTYLVKESRSGKIWHRHADQILRADGEDEAQGGDFRYEE